MPQPVSSLHPGLSALVIEQCLHFVTDHGVDTRRLFSETGFQESWLKRPEAWLSLAECEPLLRRAIELSNDPLVGLHAAHHLTLTSFGIVGLVVQTSSTLLELIESSQRYERLISDIGSTQLSHEPGQSFWRWDCSATDPLLTRHATECILAGWVERMSLIRLQPRQRLLAVRFQHALPDPALLPHYEAAFGCPVLFNQSASGLVIPSALLAEPLSLADAVLHQTLSHHAHHLLQSRHSEQTIVSQAREALKQLFAQEIAPDRELLAKKLGMSGRNLHRKLDEEKTSYRDLVDELRLESALEELRNIKQTIDVISHKLGFQESQSFIRWFKRLQGLTPGEYRQQFLSHP
jgi:AraC-like DNA-binding protein